MSIIEQTVVNTRPFNGFPGRESPIAFWFVQAEVTGDASGGFREADAVFQLSTGARTGNLFSLESLSVVDTDNNDKSLLVETSNMDAEVPQGERYDVRLVANTIAARALGKPVDLAELHGKMLWGVRNAGVTASLQFFLPNVDTAVLRVTCQGYVWSSRSRSVIGGPQRPIFGIYAR